MHGAESRRRVVRRWRRFLTLVATLLVVTGILVACKSSDSGGTPSGTDPNATEPNGSTPTICTPGAEGCSCETAGATADCGRVHEQSGHYITCSVGHATCTNGKWSACVGDHLVTKSLPNWQLGATGYHTTAGVAIACSNACDPNCSSLGGVFTDIDASTGSTFKPVGDSGITLDTDGSVTLKNDAGNCVGLQCQIATCSTAGVTTTLTGTVYDPAGNVPLPNASVYVPIFRDAALPALGSGVSCDTCGGTSLAALQVAQTDAFGRFTLTNVPSGANIPVIVQLGKWRRAVMLANVKSCEPNTVTNNCTAANPSDCVFRLPRNARDGFDPVTGTYSTANIPQLAIVTGSADPFDCLLLKAGIDASEFGDYTSNKRIHFYKSDNNGGHSLAPAYGMNVNGSTLWNAKSGGNPNISSYDAVLLPCEGGSYDKQGSSTTNTPYANIINYANAGGRAFATHFSYTWLALPAGKGYVPAPDNWSGVANWAPTGSGFTNSVNTQDPMTGTVNTSFPKGSLFAQWLQNVGATTSQGKLAIHEGRQDTIGIGAGSQQWISAYDTKYVANPNYSPLFTYNTPYGADASKQCGRIVFSDFHVSANANTSSNSACITDVDCGFGSTCQGATQGATGQCNEPCQTPSDCPNTTFACNNAVAGACVALACTKDSACGPGRKCVNGSCACSSNDDCGSGICGARTCSAINCTSSAQCGNGTCQGGTCNSVACRTNADCGLGTCGGPGRLGTCAAGFACRKDSECGTGGTCGSGTGATAGTCSTGSQACKKDSECDSNTCGTGTGAVKGTCATNGQICHLPSDCDSNLCGSGTGSALGVCATGTSTACRVNADCESTSCGTGTGATAGTCQSNGQACRVAADCDSNSCGTGTGATSGTCQSNGQICHLNTDCDSNSCGAGTGSTVGACGTNSQVCHTNAQCDSGACGTGANGSSKGVCTAGTCNGNGQCGTGGLCVGGKCTAGACSLDSNCGTAGGICSGATCTTKACANDTLCGVSKVCNGARCSTKACAGDTGCGVTATCNGATCSTKACAGDTGCPKSATCNGAKCSTPAACAGDNACLSSKSCTGSKCGNAATCAGDNGCTVSKSCTGATCGAKSCAGDVGCPVGNVCNNAKCSRSTCSNDGECPLAVCTGAKCAPPAACGQGSDCGTGGVCTNAKCSASLCNSAADCGSGSICAGSCGVAQCTKGSDCESGVCSNGTCGCSSDENCGGAERCNGAAAGTCGRACANDGECAPDRCVNGQCGGCRDSSDCHDNTYTATCGNIPSGNYGRCTSPTPGVFPGACKRGELTPQEKALEFMLFDLTACVSADSLPPPPPPVVVPSYKPGTFFEDFPSKCVAGTRPVWREFDWQAVVPGDSNIEFFAQTGPDFDNLKPVPAPLSIAKATATTSVGPKGTTFDVAMIDTSNAAGAGGSAAFNLANPPVRSQSVLRLTVTLNPSSDTLQSPSLLQWKVQYDCIPNE